MNSAVLIHIPSYPGYFLIDPYSAMKKPALHPSHPLPHLSSDPEVPLRAMTAARSRPASASPSALPNALPTRRLQPQHPANTLKRIRIVARASAAVRGLHRAYRVGQAHVRLDWEGLVSARAARGVVIGDGATVQVADACRGPGRTEGD